MLQITGWKLIKFMLEKYRIETEDDYRDALNRFLQICDDDKTKNEEALKEMLLLMDLMEKYERENCSEN